MKNKKKKSEEYLALILNDIEFHTTQHRNPFLNKILGFFKNKKETRWYGKNETTDDINKTVTINIQQLKETLEKETGKTVKFFIKKSGAPIYSGKDTMEKVEAIKKKRGPLTRFWRDGKLK